MLPAPSISPALGDAPSPRRCSQPLSLLHPCSHSIPVPAPSLFPLHPCPAPSLTPLHPCPRSIPVPDPSLFLLHPCPCSIPVPAASPSLLHPCPAPSLFPLHPCPCCRPSRTAPARQQMVPGIYEQLGSVFNQQTEPISQAAPSPPCSSAPPTRESPAPQSPASSVPRWDRMAGLPSSSVTLFYVPQKVPPAASISTGRSCESCNSELGLRNHRSHRQPQRSRAREEVSSSNLG